MLLFMWRDGCKRMTLDTTKYVHIKTNQLANMQTFRRIGVGSRNIWPGKSVFHVIIIQDFSITDFHVCVWNDWLVYINVICKFQFCLLGRHFSHKAGLTACLNSCCSLWLEHLSRPLLGPILSFSNVYEGVFSKVEVKVALGWPLKLWRVLRWEEYGTKWPWPNLMHYPDICFGSTRSTMKELSRWSLSQPGFKQDAFDYRYEALPQRMLGTLTLLPHLHELVFT